MVTFRFERGTAFVRELLGSIGPGRDLGPSRQPEPGTWDDAVDPPRARVVVAELDAQWALTKRNVSRAARTATPASAARSSSWRTTRPAERLGDVALRVLGRGAWPSTTRLGVGLDHVGAPLYALSLSIAAGTAQIQRNIVGERLLGLPKER